MQSLTKRSFAKVNLRLKVTARDVRGFHELSMLNALISLADVLEFELADRDLNLEVAAHPRIKLDATFYQPESNLIHRSYNLIKQELGKDFGLKIKLQKNIPLGGGLGGASSNAAVTLKTILELLLLEKKISQLEFDDLQKKLPVLAAQLGSDIPFFLFDSTAIVSGFGEKVFPCKNFMTGKELLLVLPNFSCNTAAVYQKFREQVSSESLSADTKLSAAILNDKILPTLVENDLYLSACSVEPKLLPLFADLKKVADQNVISLNGSGSSIFVLLAEDSAKNTAFTSYQALVSAHGAELLKVSFL